jgi:hypothetical protein
MSVKFPVNSVGPSQFTRSESLVTPEDMKTRYLFGINLSDQEGNPVPEATIQHAINSAASYLEHELDIIIFKTKFVENYDYRRVDYSDFNFIQLKKRPACNVELLRAKFPNNRELVRYPEEWYVLEKEAAQLQLSPVEGTFSGLIVTQGSGYLPLIYGTRDHWPHLFEVTYTAGFEEDCIPVIINEMIGMQAAIRLFEILGDLVLGSGIAAENVGLDGANVGKNTTASAMYSAFSARVESYRKSLDDYKKAVKKYYNGIPLAVS